MIHIDGYYENGDDEFYYDIYLRPWGTYWMMWLRKISPTTMTTGICP